MVTIIDYKQQKNSAGEEFFCLVIQGGVELIKSAESGKFYAHARKTSITSTFNEVTCKSLVGQTLPGNIEKRKCEPYQYTTQEGQEMTLDFEYFYNAEPTTMEEEVFEPKDLALA